MSVTASATSGFPLYSELDFDLVKYDADLREWGRWNYVNDDYSNDLGFPKINTLHPKHGLGARDMDNFEEMNERVREVDNIINELPLAHQKVAKHFWVFQDTKRDIAIRMTTFLAKAGKIKKVQSRDVDQWVSSIAMVVWFRIDRGKGKL
mgnify:CR=1 FL=1